MHVCEALLARGEAVFGIDNLTCADVSRLNALVGVPLRFTPLNEGLARFVRWFRDWHGTAKKRWPRAA